MFNLVVSMEPLDAWLFSKDGSLQHKKVLLHAEIEPAREDPIGFRVQRLNRSVIAAGANKLSALCSTSSFQCQPLDARLSFQCWFSVTRKDHAASTPRTWAGRSLWIPSLTTRPSQPVHFSWVRYVQPRRFNVNHLTDGFLSKAGSLSLTQKWSRCEQESNLRVKIPLDFESNALTTRPSHLMQLSRVRYVQPRRFNGTTWRMAFFPKLVLFNTKRSRCEQDSNLHGKIPLYFKSNALSTRPSQLVQLSWVRYVQPRRFNGTTWRIAFFPKLVLFNTKRYRCEQDSNLRGKIPLDFKSNALTTRPSQLVQLSWVRYVQPRRFNGTTWRMAFFPKLVLLNTKRSRCEQNSNLRGKIPLDFESNALTARPSQLVQISWVRYVQPRRFNVNHLKHCFLSTVGFFTQKGLAASRNRTCAWRSHWISNPTP